MRGLIDVGGGYEVFFCFSLFFKIQKPFNGGAFVRQVSRGGKLAVYVPREGEM